MSWVGTEITFSHFFLFNMMVTIVLCIAVGVFNLQQLLQLFSERTDN